jgi:very-short-patch-repair endonuclease
MSDPRNSEVTNPNIAPPRPAGTPPTEGKRQRREIIPYQPYLKKLARKLRNNMTLGEIILWQHLKKKQVRGYDFDRQRPIDSYIVDFYCKDLKLAIEVDGSIHDSPEAQAQDQFRQERLEACGVSFLRFTDAQVRRDVEGVVIVIQDWIDRYNSQSQP